MSELKVRPYTMLPSGQCYDKSEADKVIAEKDAEIAKLKEQVHDYAQGLYVMQARAEKEARHNKYKRCLAMAQWCMDAECKTEKDADFLVRWEYRWLALAKEPTWAKFLQLIHKEAK